MDAQPTLPRKTSHHGRCSGGAMGDKGRHWDRLRRATNLLNEEKTHKAAESCHDVVALHLYTPLDHLWATTRLKKRES
ncbi:hypothetical protein Scep_009760 [Stephania cephalantha]|uniref:Uncharacterized protein n=1 Tax=Stephania cephalantha TaxID=152367 RepID=A0AAP0PEM2_9MAGN